MEAITDRVGDKSAPPGSPESPNRRANEFGQVEAWLNEEADPILRAWFTALDDNDDGEICEEEYMVALDGDGKEAFTLTLALNFITCTLIEGRCFISEAELGRSHGENVEGRARSGHGRFVCVVLEGEHQRDVYGEPPIFLLLDVSSAYMYSVCMSVYALSGLHCVVYCRRCRLQSRVGSARGISWGYARRTKTLQSDPSGCLPSSK